MLPTPNFRAYRNSEFIAFIGDVVELSKRNNIAELASQQAELETEYLQLDRAFKVSQGSLITTDIRSLDARRDAAIRGIRGVVVAYRYHFDAGAQAAANLLLQAIDKYGKQIASMNYQAQTATLKSLIQDLEVDADLTAALTSLHLTDWVAELKTANETFETTYLDRVRDNANKKMAPVSEYRPAAVEAYTTFVKHIEANNILNPSAALTDLIGQLQQLIEKYNVL